jgi:hypothetical protein
MIATYIVRTEKVGVQLIGNSLSYHMKVHTVCLAPINHLIQYRNQHRMVALVYRLSLNPSNTTVDREQIHNLLVSWGKLEILTPQPTSAKVSFVVVGKTDRFFFVPVVGEVEFPP